MRIRISKKTLAEFPLEVSSKLLELAKEYNTWTVDFNFQPGNHQFYTREGSRYVAIKGAALADAQVVSESSLGGSGMSHNIGGLFNMPVGSWLIEVWYYTRFGFTMTNVLDTLPDVQRIEFNRGARIGA